MKQPIPIAILSALVAFSNIAAAQSRTAVLEEQLIFEQAPFTGCHASTIAESEHGLVAAFFAGTDEGHDDVGIWVSHRDRGAAGWSPPTEVADGVEAGVDYPAWNPVLFQAPAGPLLLFYKVGPSPPEWWGVSMRSDDGGRSWSAPQRLPDDILGPVRAKPLLLDDGTLLAGSSTEHDGWRLHFERTSDLGANWQSTGPIHDGKTFGAIQPAFLHHADGRIQAVARSRQNRIVETWSDDGGRSWSALEATDLPNPSAGIDALTLPDGRHLLVYNHTSRLVGERPADGTRSELNLAISRDGRTWQAALLLERQPGEYSYPAMIRTAGGLVHLSYTYRRRRIKHVVVDPERLEPRDFVDGGWPD